MVFWTRERDVIMHVRPLRRSCQPQWLNMSSHPTHQNPKHKSLKKIKKESRPSRCMRAFNAGYKKNGVFRIGLDSWEEEVDCADEEFVSFKLFDQPP